MDVIRFPCPRCGKHLKVPLEKAGHQGRCPTCGGRIRVPENVGVEHIAERGEGHLWAIVVGIVGVVVVIVIGIVAFSGKDEQPATTTATTPTNTGTVRSDEFEKVKAHLVQLDDLEDRLKTYREHALSERRLRARDVRTRLNSYEPVSQYECNLRKEVLAQRDEALAAAAAGDVPKDDWQLDTPLTELERGDLTLLSQRMEERSRKLAAALRRVGIVTSLEPDPLGRTLLDVESVGQKIAAERKRLKERESALRQKARASG